MMVLEGLVAQINSHFYAGRANSPDWVEAQKRSFLEIRETQIIPTQLSTGGGMWS